MTKIVFFADNDVTSDAKAVNAAMMKEENVDAYCFVGDGPYSESGTGWVSMMKQHFDDKKDKMIWSRGNHDEDESESKQTQKDMEAWFPEAKSLGISDTWLISKQVGNVYIISMDSQDMDIEFKRDQYNWVAAELVKAKQLRAEGKIDWIVALFHKPAFTLKSSHSPYTAVRFLYKDIFADAQLDFWVHGHNHNTQLWKPMVPDQSQANGEGEQKFTLMSDNKTFDFSKEHGWMGIVTGHAGHEWNAINDSGSGVQNVQYYRDEGKFGYTVIETDGKKAKVLAKDTDNATLFETLLSRDGTTNPPDPTNKPPIANAGPDQIVASKANVMLNGSASTDPDGTVLQSYKWEQISGPTTVTLNNANNAIASFTAPDLFGGQPPPPTKLSYKFSHKWGSNGTGNGQFRQLEGIAVDRDGDIYVGDWVRHDIQRFKPDGTFVRRYGGTVGNPSSANGEFNTPFSIRFDPRDGHMWVADQFNHRLQKINRDTGAYMGQIGPTIPGLSNPSNLNEPEDLDFDPVDYSMYINDQHNSRIIKVDASGNFVTKWQPFSEPYPEEYPEGMSVNPVTRNLYVTAYFSTKASVFSPTGQLLFDITLPAGTGPGQFTLPMERNCFHNDGTFYQLNGNPQPKVYVFDSAGKLLTEFGSGPGSADGQLEDAEQLAVDKNHYVYVTDQNNYRISVFEPTNVQKNHHLNQVLTFKLTVTDNKGAQADDSVLVTVAENPPPDCSDPAKCIDPQTGICRPIGANEHKSPTNGLCMKNPDPGCPPGQHKDEHGNCVPDDTGQIICPRDWHYDQSLQKCIPDLEPDIPPVCPAGTTWNGKICVRDTVEPCPNSHCRDPTNGQCRPIAIDEIVDVNGYCRPKPVTGCPDGQCKDLATGQCRPIGANEEKDPITGTCKPKLPTGCPSGQCKDPVTNQCRPPGINETIGPDGYCKPLSTGGDTDEFGMKILYGKPTGKKKAMEKGTDHENGQRYNVNHEYHNYIMQGYFKLGQGQEKINHKGDGPNHGGCSDAKVCLWYELDYVLASGKGELQYENPHPTNHDVPDDKCEFVKTLQPAKAGDWIGWACAYYWGPDGKRHIRSAVDLDPFDANGKPKNNWQDLVFAIEKGQIVSSISHPRDMQKVIDHEAGLESEIRMHRATNHDTEMKNVWVIELEPQGTPS